MGISRIDVRYRSATHRDRYRMLAGIARPQTHLIMVLVVVRGGPLMIVCGKAVLVLWMIVIGVLVNVQRRNLSGGRNQDHSEQDCN